jgi:hypothetical protein
MRTVARFFVWHPMPVGPPRLPALFPPGHPRERAVEGQRMIRVRLSSVGIARLRIAVVAMAEHGALSICFAPVGLQQTGLRIRSRLSATAGTSLAASFHAILIFAWGLVEQRSQRFVPGAPESAHPGPRKMWEHCGVDSNFARFYRAKSMR